MPIYEYECRTCGHQFELIVLKGTVLACPSCQGQELERLLSGFAVSTEGIRQSNLAAARRRFAGSRDVKDKRLAEGQEVKEHLQDDYGIDVTRKIEPAKPK